MSSWTAVFFLCGLVPYLVPNESSAQTPNENPSQPDLHCSFEERSYCSWRDVSPTSDLRWTPYEDRGLDSYRKTGPTRDHTTGSGYFLSTRTSRYNEQGRALLESPPISTNNETCFSFWYFMYGGAVGGLNVFKIGNGEVKQGLFTMYGPQGNRWYRAVIKTGHGNFKLQIEATSISNRNDGDIAIDDTSFSYQDCDEDDSTLVKDQPRIDCDFEDDLCGWYFLEDDRITWSIKNVPADSKDRNAVNPKSNGTSYVETNLKSNRYSKSAMLKSPSISVDSRQACLSFWCRRNGSANTNLRVKMYQHAEGDYGYYGGNTLYSTRFSSGPMWIQGSVTLPKGDNVYLTFIVQSYGDGEDSVAVDDVRLTHGGPCLEVNQVNCDFESDFCRWYMKTKKDEGDWIRTKDPTPTNSTGPTHDHTTGDGYYIFLDASDVQEANLYSSPFDVESSGACLSFWYYMHGADVNTLKLRTDAASSYYSGISWSIKGPQGDQWIQHNISLHQGDDTWLIFSANRSYFPRGDIALDDISITFGAPCGIDMEGTTTVVVPTVIYPEITRPENTTDSHVVAVTSPTTTTTTTTTELPPLNPPKLLVKGKVDPAYNNSRVELVCQPDGERYWIRWYKRNRQHHYVEKEMFSDRWTKNLVFEEIGPENAGFYSCAVQRRNYYSPISNTSKEVEIRVVPDPRPSPQLTINGPLVHPGKPIDVEVDSVASLECGEEVNGGEYHWKTTSHAFNSLNLPKERILVLNGTQPKHSGFYSCRISKDEYWSGKSNQLEISVKPGKRCKSDWHCYGDDYYDDCKNHRCKCSYVAVVKGRKCQRRPGTPKITTSPEFLEFDIGESFYLVCQAHEPAPTNLTYTFSHRYRKLESLSILKITNATASDSGSYSCHVTYNGVNSRDSNIIRLKVQDLLDLNCDFENGQCKWFQNKETDTADFTLVSRDTDNDDDDDEQNNGPNGPYMQLDAGNTTVPNRAVLISPTIDRMALNACLSFWYRMHGMDAYSLSVWSYAYSKDSKRYGGSNLWTIIGNKGDEWFKQNVTVGNGSDFYLTIDAIGQVAIDDIKFTYRGGC